MHHKIAKKFEARRASIHLVKEYNLAFKADFGFRKKVLRAETRFAIIELYRNKSKNEFFVSPVGQKVVS